MSELQYNFYMVQCDKYGKVASEEEEINLEQNFQGMRYSKAEGLDKIGKPKNIYSEKYANSDRLRVHVPNEITNEATNVTFNFVFVGDNRQKVYRDFLEYVRKGFHRYYDDARKKYLYFCVNSELKPAEEKQYGSVPYLKFELEVQNIFGRTFDSPIV